MLPHRGFELWLFYFRMPSTVPLEIVSIDAWLAEKMGLMFRDSVPWLPLAEESRSHNVVPMRSVAIDQ